MSICQVLTKIVFYRQGVDKRLVDDNTNGHSCHCEATSQCVQ